MNTLFPYTTLFRSPHLADEQKRQVLDEALAAAREINSPYTRAEALAALVPHLADEQKRQVLDEALSAAREIDDPYARAEALAALAPHPADEQKRQVLDEALAAAREIDSSYTRAEALAALAPHVVTYPLWRDTLQASASLTLPQLLGNLKDLVPASVALGGQGAVDDIARAILDLTR